MKTTIFPTNNVNGHDDLVQMILQEHHKIVDKAYADGKFCGMKEPEQPFLNGDKFTLYIGGYKASYEQLALRVLEKYHPATHLPEGRIDANWAEMHNQRLTADITKLERQINLLKNELRSYDPGELAARLQKIYWIGLGVFTGEMILNTQAFQVTGDNLLASLGLSASVSFTVCMGAHFAGRRYKDAKTPFERRIILVCSAVGITAFSIVIASLRTFWMARMGVNMDPLNFVIFNIGFFAIAALANWYYHPTKEEIEENRDKLHKYNQIKKLEKEKEKKQRELIAHQLSSKEVTKTHMREPVLADYAIEMVKRLYREAVEAFKTGNIQCRTDMPDCFSHAIPDLDIPEITFKGTINKYKNNDENNHNNSAA